jgi:hypothetical protein
MGTPDDASFENVMRDHARRLGISLAQLLAASREEPLVLFAARREADRRGCTVDEVLRDTSGSTLTLFGPTECLTVDELDSFTLEGRPFSAARESHVAKCALCAGILSATNPPADRVEAFLHEVRRIAAGVVPEPVGGGETEFATVVELEAQRSTRRDQEFPSAQNPSSRHTELVGEPPEGAGEFFSEDAIERATQVVLPYATH